MKIIFMTILTPLLFIYAQNCFANDEPVKFKDSLQEEQYYDLLEEVRCLVCQNQSLADSNAPLAQDLRNEIYEMVNSKKNNNEILDFLVKRYGDFVLYRPPLKKNTWLLWFGPFLILIIAISIGIIVIKKQIGDK